MNKNYNNQLVDLTEKYELLSNKIEQNQISNEFLKSEIKQKND